MPPGDIIDRKQRRGEIRSDTHAKRKCHWEQGTQVLSEEKSQGPVEEGRKRKSERWNIIGDEWSSVLNDVLVIIPSDTTRCGHTGKWAGFQLVQFISVGRKSIHCEEKEQERHRQVRRGYSKHTMFHWQAGKQKVDIRRHCSSTSTHNGGRREH